MAISKKIVSRYANIFLAHAVQSEKLEEVNAGVVFLQTKFRDNPLLNGVLHNPTIPHFEKKKLLAKLCKNDISPILWRFIEIIITQAQIDQLNEVLNAFSIAYQDHIGIKSALLTTAIPLPEALVEQFIKKVKQLGNCKEVLLEQHIDPSIIGGYVLQIGALRLNRSVKQQLQLLKNKLQ